MSTQIKNTLYRFVTMRAPELLEERKSKESFVLHPEEQLDSSETIESLFLASVYSIPEGKTKKQVLQETAENFGNNNARKTKKSIVELVGNQKLTVFAEWLTKNRTTLTYEKIKAFLEKLGTTEKISSDEIRIKLWDNLFYQIFTFQSGTIRDFILSVLVADSFITKGKVSKENEDILKRLAQARVVIPKTIFSPESGQSNAVYRKSGSENLTVDRNLAVTTETIIAEKQLKQFEELVSELSEVKKRYDKNNARVKAEYDKEYDVLVELAYQKATKIEKIYINPKTKIKSTYFEFENLVLPVYSFTPISQLAFLKDEKFASNNLKTFAITAEENKGFETFEEFSSLAKEMIKKVSEFLFSRKTVTEKVAVTGGAVIAARTTGYTARTSNGFILSDVGTGATKRLLLTFIGMEQGTNIDSGYYTVTMPDGSQKTGENYSNPNDNDDASHFEIFNYTGNYFETTENGAISIEGTFITTAGRELNINGTGSISVTTSSGSGSGSGSGSNSNANPHVLSPLQDMFYKTLNGNQSYTVRGHGKYVYEDPNVITEIENPQNPSPQNPQNSGSTTMINNGSSSVIDYIPTGYGIKRLGIADYRRVEQEVCCYVPGEVSHIENVMAREYKEKSTRRLRRQEDTLTTSKEKETEKLSDTTSTERFEMNQEIASVLAQQNSAAFHSGMSSSAYKVHFDVSADFAHNTSKETSNIQALNEAQEVTERVLERVVQKIKEERVTKIIEEYEENSKHGYDNRKGDKHISGVYRWVDKIMRNKVINYGKRLMYEFMIPEPASFHNAVMDAKKVSPGVEILEKPIDPRTADILPMKTFSDVKEETYSHWAAIYNAEVSPMPLETIKVGKSLKLISPKGRDQKFFSITDEITIPERYSTAKGYSTAQMMYHLGSREWPQIITTIGEISKSLKCLPNSTNGRWDGISNGEGADVKENGYVEHVFTNPFFEKVPIAATAYDSEPEAHATFSVLCQLTDEAKKQWQLETFNAIITAYETRLADYNEKVTNAKAVQKERAKTNPMFNRQVENIVLRKNCIEYLIGQAALGKTSLLQGSVPRDIRAKYDDPALESYSAKVKFFEQAFEWDLMSYYFYPFYWADKTKWVDMYQIDEMDDATFKAFLESGMARVIVTVRPGFEEAVNWYMATGQVWNGGQVPTMSDELFMSIVDELREQTGEVEETWESRVPTSLTVIQAGNIGLNVQGLPCDEECEDNLMFTSDGEQIKIISQNVDADGNDILLGNSVENLDTVSESIEEIKTDIESIQSTLESLAKNQS